MRKIIPIALVVIFIALVGIVLYGPEAQVSSGAKPNHPRAERVEGILDEMEANYDSGKVPRKSYTITEPELNAYVEAKLREQEGKGVETFSIRLKQGTFVTFLMINLHEVEVKGDSMTLDLFKALLSGHPTLEVEGELAIHNGMGTYAVQRARLNDIPVPASLVNAILSSVGKRQDPPFDPTEPFEMPYGIRKVTVEPQKVTIFTEPGNGHPSRSRVTGDQ